jgi:two-component system sensor histidine kinase DesK
MRVGAPGADRGRARCRPRRARRQRRALRTPAHVARSPRRPWPKPDRDLSQGRPRRRLIGADRAAAAREIGELEAVASSLAAEIEAVGRDEREVAFATEAGAAVDLLRLAGIDVRATLDVDGIAPDASAVLGFAVREGATNILRHADARHCTIHALRQDGVIRLELVNDGAGTRRTHGTGLQNLADRLAELDGRAAGGPLGGGRFRLRVEVPA